MSTRLVPENCLGLAVRQHPRHIDNRDGVPTFDLVDLKGVSCLPLSATLNLELAELAFRRSATWADREHWLDRDPERGDWWLPEEP